VPAISRDLLLGAAAGGGRAWGGAGSSTAAAAEVERFSAALWALGPREEHLGAAAFGKLLARVERGEAAVREGRLAEGAALAQLAAFRTPAPHAAAPPASAFLRAAAAAGAHFGEAVSGGQLAAACISYAHATVQAPALSLRPRTSLASAPQAPLATRANAAAGHTVESDSALLAASAAQALGRCLAPLLPSAVLASPAVDPWLRSRPEEERGSRIRALLLRGGDRAFLEAARRWDRARAEAEALRAATVAGLVAALEAALGEVDEAARTLAAGSKSALAAQPATAKAKPDIKAATASAGAAGVGQKRKAPASAAAGAGRGAEGVTPAAEKTAVTALSGASGTGGGGGGGGVASVRLPLLPQLARAVRDAGTAGIATVVEAFLAGLGDGDGGRPSKRQVEATIRALGERKGMGGWALRPEGAAIAALEPAAVAGHLQAYPLRLGPPQKAGGAQAAQRAQVGAPASTPDAVVIDDEDRSVAPGGHGPVGGAPGGGLGGGAPDLGGSAPPPPKRAKVDGAGGAGEGPPPPP